MFASSLALTASLASLASLAVLPSLTCKVKSGSFSVFFTASSVGVSPAALMMRPRASLSLIALERDVVGARAFPARRLGLQPLAEVEQALAVLDAELLQRGAVLRVAVEEVELLVPVEPLLRLGGRRGLDAQQLLQVRLAAAALEGGRQLVLGSVALMSVSVKGWVTFSRLAISFAFVISVAAFLAVRATCSSAFWSAWAFCLATLEAPSAFCWATLAASPAVFCSAGVFVLSAACRFATSAAFSAAAAAFWAAAAARAAASAALRAASAAPARGLGTAPRGLGCCRRCRRCRRVTP